MRHRNGVIINRKEGGGYQERKRTPDLDYRFADTLEVGTRRLDWAAEFGAPKPFHTVGCMFAAHYFFVSRACVDRFLGNVASALCDGGFFFGTLPLAPVRPWEWRGPDVS